MKTQLMSVVTLSLATLLSTSGALAQEPTPKGCFVFSDKSESVVVGYQDKFFSWSNRPLYKECPKDVVIPDSVTKIGEWAFNGKKLTSVVIGNSVTWIGWRAFALNQLTSVVIGNSVTKIDEAAFAKNNLTSVVIPDSVTEIGERAFLFNCLDSKSVSLPKALQSQDTLDSILGNQAEDQRNCQ